MSTTNYNIIEQLNNSNDNIEYKICRQCDKELSVERFRQKRRVCKKCVCQNEKEIQKNNFRNYYLNNKEKLNNRRMELYYRNKQKKTNHEETHLQQL